MSDTRKLRAAAALMRERADSATASPWTHGHEGLQGGEVIRSGELRVARVYKRVWPDYLPDCENAEHIASWHPDAARAVARMLEVEADLRDSQPRGFYEVAEADEIATAYLGADYVVPELLS